MEWKYILDTWCWEWKCNNDLAKQVFPFLLSILMQISKWKSTQFHVSGNQKLQVL